VPNCDSAGWMALSQRVGDKIARLVGAGPGELVVADSTSVNLFKVLSAALHLAGVSRGEPTPGAGGDAAHSARRHVIVSERSNFPTDLYTMLTMSVQLRYSWASAFSNRTWDSLTARVISGSTILAASTSGGAYQTVASSITTTTPTNSSVVAFSYVNTTARRSVWESAVLEIQIITTRSGGGSTIERRIYAGQLTGTYSTGTTIKAYSGSVWQAGMLKRHVSGEWKPSTLKRWDGSSWVQVFGKG